jgi:hypothetical protein
MLSFVNKNLTAHMSANPGTSPSSRQWENSLDFWEFMNVVCDTKPNKQTLRHPKEEHEATAHRRKRKTRNHQLTTPSNSQPTTLSNQNIMLFSFFSNIYTGNQPFSLLYKTHKSHSLQVSSAAFPILPFGAIPLASPLSLRCRPSAQASRSCRNFSPACTRTSTATSP